MTADMTPVPVPRQPVRPSGAPRWDGKRARQRRQWLSLTLADVAAATGLHRDTLKAMERNTIRPSEAAFLRLTWAYRLRADNAAEVLCVRVLTHDQRPDEAATEAQAAARALRTSRRTARLSGLVAARQQRKRESWR